MTMNKTLIQIKNLKKFYFERNKIIKEALRGISFDIFKGEIFSLLGINGAGKTTLSSIIATLHPATSGEILFNGKSIYSDLINFRRIVGFCPQKPNIDSLLTIEENLIFAGKYYGLTRKEIYHQKDKLINQFKLEEYKDSYADVLSGGYKQRFLIARTLMHKPKLVILDEPTVGLDPHIRHQLWSIIKELKDEGVTVLITTHYMDEADYLSDRVCIINNGLIVTIDTPEKLKSTYQKEKLEDIFLQLSQENNI